MHRLIEWVHEWAHGFTHKSKHEWRKRHKHRKVCCVHSIAIIIVVMFMVGISYHSSLLWLWLLLFPSLLWLSMLVCMVGNMMYEQRAMRYATMKSTNIKHHFASSVCTQNIAHFWGGTALLPRWRIRPMCCASQTPCSWTVAGRFQQPILRSSILSNSAILC